MEYNFKTKWNKEKIEKILKDNDVQIKRSFNSELGMEYICFFKFYDKTISIEIALRKTHINIDFGLFSTYYGIKSYKKLDEVLGDYNKEAKTKIWEKLSFAERLCYISKEDYNKTGNTKLAEGIVNILEGSLRNNTSKLKSAFDIK